MQFLGVMMTSLVAHAFNNHLALLATGRLLKDFAGNTVIKLVHDPGIYSGVLHGGAILITAEPRSVGHVGVIYKNYSQKAVM